MEYHIRERTVHRLPCLNYGLKELNVKNFLTVLLTMVAVGLFAQSKAEFSIVIRPVESTVKAGSPVEVEVRKTNLTDHVLPIGGFNREAAYTYDVRRDGVPVAEAPEAKKMKQPRGFEGSMIDGSLPPHRTQTDTIAVNANRDMSQPGKYTIQLQQGRVESNTVTVTVEP